MDEMIKQVESLEIKLNYAREENGELKMKLHKIEEHNRFLQTGRVIRFQKNAQGSRGIQNRKESVYWRNSPRKGDSRASDKRSKNKKYEDY